MRIDLEEIGFLLFVISLLLAIIFVFIAVMYDIKNNKEIKMKELELQYQNIVVESE